jgi:hypothetical protein
LTETIFQKISVRKRYFFTSLADVFFIVCPLYFLFLQINSHAKENPRSYIYVRYKGFWNFTRLERIWISIEALVNNDSGIKFEILYFFSHALARSLWDLALATLLVSSISDSIKRERNDEIGGIFKPSGALADVVKSGVLLFPNQKYYPDMH